MIQNTVENIFLTAAAAEQALIPLCARPVQNLVARLMSAVAVCACHNTVTAATVGLNV